ncbi:MAG: hypothetical protein QHH19_02550 [Candidatus Thermoplasmatota archaeon]|jgi:hypothetical protein|nr:hypothetical protein [Candidatus Thermoplasmatota archaeon]
MAVLTKLGEGWVLLADSFRFLRKKPIFLVPLFFSWIFVAAIVLILRYYIYFGIPHSLEEFYLILLFIFLIIFLITLIICMANIVMLEFIQQIELGEKISFGKALKEAVILDSYKVIPVALIWAIVWFIILIIKVLTSKKKGRTSRPTPSPRDAALTLAGYNSGPFSWFKLGLRMFEKLFRMYIFLTLPAIAWENKGPFSAFKRSLEIIKKHPLQFLTTYTLTGVAAFFMAIPILIILLMVRAGMDFPDLFWMGVIIYEGIVWTLGIYLEQMSVGLLYLWHLKWVKNGETGELSSVPRPDLLDEYYELKEYAKI